jgi:hypothetical protein
MRLLQNPRGHPNSSVNWREVPPEEVERPNQHQLVSAAGFSALGRVARVFHRGASRFAVARLGPVLSLPRLASRACIESCETRCARC